MRGVSMEGGMLETLRANLISKTIFKIVSSLMFIQIFSHFAISNFIK